MIKTDHAIANLILLALQSLADLRFRSLAFIAAFRSTRTAAAGEPTVRDTVGMSSQPRLSLSRVVGICLGFGGVITASSAADSAPDPIQIGSRLELFVDDFLVERMEGIERKLHTPARLARPKSPLPDRFYCTILKDDELFRAYWRDKDPDYPGSKEYFAENPEEVAKYAEATGMKPERITAGDYFAGHPGTVVRYAESGDGHEWNFPKLGLVEVAGTKENNVILKDMPPFLSNFTPFIDTNPEAPKAERYKALGGHPGYFDKRGQPGRGLHAFVSADGLRWKRMGEAIPFPEGTTHAFDSQNVSFWSEAEQQYVAYFRTYKTPWGMLPSITRATSPDFFNWSKPDLVPPNRKGERLYTSQTHPYFRAPHIYIALPTRYFKERDSITDIAFMTTRAGTKHYDRPFPGSFIRPGLDANRWGNRSNYLALNVHPTGPAEMSMWHKSGHRYVLRTDGFMSIHAGVEEGELITKPLRFEGRRLEVNVSTSAGGSVRVEVLDQAGRQIDGFALDDCDQFFGDDIDHVVSWNGSQKVAALSGRVIRLRFVLQEADLYSLRFRP